jgi:uncharacterized membrane protein YeaQ/YmgE (transglycosylase-associated protein family)
MHLLYFLLIGLVAGWLANQILRGSSKSYVEDMIIGVIGALLGGFLFGVLGLSANGLIGELVTATVGAIIFIYLLRYLRRG